MTEVCWVRKGYKESVWFEKGLSAGSVTGKGDGPCGKEYKNVLVRKRKESRTEIGEGTDQRRIMKT